MINLAGPQTLRSTTTPMLSAIALVLVTLALTLVGASAARAAAFAPVDEPGPALDVPVAQLQAALTCSPLVGHSDKEPVLLVPGTAATFKVQFSWNFAIALTKLGIPWCGVSPPEYQLGDIQIAGEYDVYAIRYLYHHSGDRQIAVVGHSQGGMQPRWALRFWPDTRAMVADDVGIAPDNQGVSDNGIGPTGTALCHSVGECPTTLFQQFTGSRFIAALNSGQEMFAGIDYTVIYSESDEAVLPDSTPLDGPSFPGRYARISLQQVCSGHIADHLQNGSVDPVSWALTLDAITHRGPAVASRIPSAVCSQLINPELNPASAAVDGAQAAAELAYDATQAPFSHGEPPLRCYVFAICTGAAAPTLEIWKITKPRTLRAGEQARIHVLVRTDEGGVLQPVPRAIVTLAGHHETTDDDGDTTFVIRLPHTGNYALRAARSGCNPASTYLQVRRRR